MSLGTVLQKVGRGAKAVGMEIGKVAAQGAGVNMDWTKERNAIRKGASVVKQAVMKPINAERQGRKIQDDKWREEGDNLKAGRVPYQSKTRALINKK